MAMQNENVQTEDTGLLALWLFLRLHGVNAAFDQIRERGGTTTVGIRAMLRCAGQLGIGTRSHTTHWNRLVSMRLPGIASLRDGGFLLRADDNGALVLYPSAPHPELITRAEFEAIWDGRVVSAGSPGFTQRVRHTLADTGIHGRSLAGLVLIVSAVLRPRL
jgi:ATP-binding cassette, subfamily B, bacterial HlyB/CyaB